MALPTLTGTGRLYADPDLKFSQSGTAVGKIPLAFNSRRKNQQTGEWEDGDSFFITGVLFGDSAESAVEALRKGTEVLVAGRLKTRSWEQDGQKRSITEMSIDSIAPTLRANAKKSQRSGTPASNDQWSQSSQGGFSDDPPF
jgi:single-strand DNA-binding protein